MHELSERYPVWLCDVWGVIHNGFTPFQPSVEGLVRHRQNGGTVILITNSPRTTPGVVRQLDDIGVDPASYDRTVTSGDVTQELMQHHGGGKVFHLGPERDLSIFEGTGVARVPVSEAHAVLCSGLFDDVNDDPQDYHPLLDELRQRDLVMICANPDRVVKKGDRLLYCAGTLADIYAAKGGKVLMAGKPFAPMYDDALALAADLRGGEVDRSQVLAIGDGPETDIRGAADYGLDAVLVAEGVIDASAGLHAVEAAVRKAVPHARIVKTVHDLAWT
jgi:HAD superfamily hydrolase (TIGR01459 family)